ncbi:Heat shock transcription factor [Ceraceosorus bombacis]|uniref:Heat shock transcription factor n=2 Tax=Ceraceosorus TaxID=401624 RepID=A0A0P1BQA0_9BASI|nr:Heat shock transcription factor [Ceraceosorus bombacis]
MAEAQVPTADEPSAGSSFSLAQYGLDLDDVGEDGDMDEGGDGGNVAPASEAAAGFGPQASTSAAPQSSGEGAGHEERRSASSSARVPMARNNPFLNKLRSMVDDPKTNELIRWSDDGESFLVPNQNRFEDEVLPRYFKHNRFPSFVRQLNMYGFHKVPHLQQGALKHDSPQVAELWEFRNDHFHRDKPELLTLMSRKKAAPRGVAAEKEGAEGNGKARAVDEEIDDKMEGPTGLNAVTGALMRNTGALAADTKSEGTLQLASIWQAIQSIQGAQQGINDNLRHLHNTNAELRREAIEQRQRSLKQQETINKMLRFLAGVFGGQDAGVEASANIPGGAGPRPAETRRNPSQRGQQGRLMIGDGSSPPSSAIFELLDDIKSGGGIDGSENTKRFTEAGSATSSPKDGGSPQSRFINLPSSPDADMNTLHDSAPPTPGGTRRMSQQAQKQILDALSSGQGADWLAQLFGGEGANAAMTPAASTSRVASATPSRSGTPFAASTPGSSGMKFDQSTLAALQSILSGGGNAQAEHAAKQSALPNETDSRFSFFNDAPDWDPAAANAPSTSRALSAPNAVNGLHSWAPDQGASGLPWSSAFSQATSTSRGEDASQIYVPGQGELPFPSLSKHDTAPPAPLSPSAQNQLAVTLQRASQGLAGTSNDSATVQNAINALVEGLRQDPSLLNNLAAFSQPGQEGSATPVASTSGTQPYAPPNSTQGITSAEPAGEVDMDSLLREFLEAGATGSSAGTPAASGEAPLADPPSTTLNGTHSPTSTSGARSGTATNPSTSTNSPNLGRGSRANSPSTATHSAAPRKRAPPPEFEGALGADIEVANAKARKAPRHASVRTAGAE